MYDSSPGKTSRSGLGIRVTSRANIKPVLQTAHGSGEQPELRGVKLRP